MPQVDALTGVQGLSAEQLSALWAVTPLVLDLNGDGVRTVSIDAGIKFDLNATGYATEVGWVSAQDGFLALDRNHDGKINDGSELFGSATQLATGGKAKDGFDALGDLDTNNDGVINASDAQFSELTVWSDSNQDGISQSDEIHSLSDLGITQVSLDAQQHVVRDEGNWIGLESSFSTLDGSTHAMADVWLRINQGFDLTTGDPSRVPLEGLGRIDMSGNGGPGDLLTLDSGAVEKYGQQDLVVNEQTGSGYVQLMIQGDANDTVKLTDAEHWTRTGTTVVDGASYEVLTDGNAQLLVGVKLQPDPTG
jgi:hypothetical protein